MSEISKEPAQADDKYKITTGHGEFIGKSKEQKGIAVTEDFRNLLKEYPHAIAVILSLVGKITKDQLSVADGNIKVNQVYTEVDKKIGTGKQTSDIYKVEIGNHAFFMKTQNKEYAKRFGGGLHEFTSRIKLKELFKDIPNVEIIDYKLGYTGKKNKYFISTWIEHSDDIVEMDRFINLDYKLHQEKSRELSDRTTQITDNLRDFYELDIQNFLYDIKRDTILIQDTQLIKKDWRKFGVRSQSLHDSVFTSDQS